MLHLVADFAQASRCGWRMALRSEFLFVVQDMPIGCWMDSIVPRVSRESDCTSNRLERPCCQKLGVQLARGSCVAVDGRRRHKAFQTSAHLTFTVLSGCGGHLHQHNPVNLVSLQARSKTLAGTMMHRRWCHELLEQCLALCFMSNIQATAHKYSFNCNWVIGCTIAWSIVPVSHRISGIVIARLSLPAHHRGRKMRPSIAQHFFWSYTLQDAKFKTCLPLGEKSITPMLQKHKKHVRRNMYPTRHVIHKLGASHHIKVPEVDMLVLVRHGISLRSGHVSMSLTLQLTQKTSWIDDYNKCGALSQSIRNIWTNHGGHKITNCDPGWAWSSW